MEKTDRGVLQTQGRLTYKPHIFSSACKSYTVSPGETIEDAIGRIDYPRDFKDLLRVYCDRQFIPQQSWGRYRLQAGSEVFVAFVPGKDDDGKNPLAFVASIALIVAAPVAGKGIAKWFGVTSEVGIALATAGFTLVGSSLINSVFPPPAADFNQLGGRSAPESQNYRSEAARNKLELETSVISLYGRHKMFPNYAASPYTVMSGDAQYIYMLFDAGYGRVDISEQKFGQERLVSAYEEAEVVVHKEFVAGDSLDFYTNDVFTDTFSLVVSKEVSRIVTTQLDTQEAQLDLTFTRGLVTFGNSANRVNRKVKIRINYRQVGQTNWLPLFSAPKVNFTSDTVTRAGMYDSTIILDTLKRITPGDNRSEVLVNGAYKLQTSLGVFYTAYIDSNTPIEVGDILIVQGIKYDILQSNRVQRGLIGAQRFEVLINKNFPGNLFSTRLVGEVIHPDPTAPQDTSTFQLHSPAYEPKPNDTIQINGRPYEIETVTAVSGFNTYQITTFDELQYDMAFDRQEYNYNRVKGLGQYAYVSLKDVKVIDRVTAVAALEIERATAQNFTVGVNVVLPLQGQYEFQVIRETDDSSSDQTFDEFAITQLRSIQYVTPVAPDKPRTLIEMKVKVNEQINGIIEDYNFIGQRHLLVGDGLGGYTLQLTRNPAWIALDILTGDIAPRPLPLTKINHQSFKDFADWCDTLNADGEPKFMCDFVMDFETTVRQLVNQVVSVGRGVLIQTDGVYEIAIDQPKSTPKQLLTPRNTSGFNGSRSFPDRKDYINTRFVDPASGWKLRPIKVYDDGKDENNSTTFEAMDVFGVTRERQAWEQTRWTMAQAISRSTQYTVKTDMEYLTCKRGDLVYLQHDVPRAGGIPARLNGKTVVSTGPGLVKTEFYLDRDIVDQALPSYELFIRQGNGTITQVTAAEYYTAGGPNIFRSPERADTDPDPYADVFPGDLMVYGEADSTVRECIVKEIIPQDELAAELVLTDYAPEIQTADSGALPQYNPRFSRTEINAGAPGLVNSVQVTQDIEYKDRQPVISVSLTWNVPLNSTYAAAFEIYVLQDEGYKLIDTVTQAPYLYIDSTRQDQLNIFGKPLTFKILAVSNTGNKLQLSQVEPVEFIPQKDNVAPAAPKNVRLSIVNGQLRLVWQNPGDVDLDGVEIRRSSSNQWDGGQTVSLTNFNVSQAEVEAVEAFYVLRARDTTGNLSTPISTFFRKVPPSISAVDVQVLGETIRFDISTVEGSGQLRKFRVYDSTGAFLLAESESSIFDVVGTADTELGSISFLVEVEDEIGQKVQFSTGAVQVFDGQEYYDFGDIPLGDIERIYSVNSQEGNALKVGDGLGIKFNITTGAPTINDIVSDSRVITERTNPRASMNTLATTYANINDWASNVVPNGGSINDAVQNTNLTLVNQEKHVSMRTLARSGFKNMNAMGQFAQARLRYTFGVKRLRQLLVDVGEPTKFGSFDVATYIVVFSSYINNPMFGGVLYLNPTRYPLIGNRALLKDVIAFDIVFEIKNTVPAGTTGIPPALPIFEISFPPDYLRIRALIGQNSGEAEVANTPGGTEIEWTDYFYDPEGVLTEAWNIRPQATALDVNRGYVEVVSRSEKRFFAKVYDSAGVQTSGRIRWTKSGILLSQATPENLV